jgi:predicted deacetylase
MQQHKMAMSSTRSSTRRAAVACASATAFVATGRSYLVEFVDAVSLAHFAATSKEYRPLLYFEMARRKAMMIQGYEEWVKQLIGCDDQELEFHVRANAEGVERLRQAAKHLSRCGPFFRDERAHFVPPRVRTGR